MLSQADLAVVIDPLRQAERRRHTEAEVAAVLERVGLDQARSALAEHGLELLVLDALERQGTLARLGEPFLEALRAARRRAAAQHMLNEWAAEEATRVLDGAGIAHVIWRGLELSRLYADPSLRPAADVDLLVAPGSRDAALRALVAAGWTGHVVAKNATHEVALTARGATLDLHWAVFRPGRSRRELAPLVLDSRRRAGGLCFADATATALVLLLHTALTDHVTARLLRGLDLDLLWQAGTVDRERLDAWLGDTGLMTAAWATALWVERSFGTPITQALEPPAGRLRRAYLEQVVALDPGRVARRWPGLVGAGFSLLLQDSPGDVLRAVRSLAAARRRAGRDAEELAGVLSAR